MHRYVAPVALYFIHDSILHITVRLALASTAGGGGGGQPPPMSFSEMSAEALGGWR